MKTTPSNQDDAIPHLLGPDGHIDWKHEAEILREAADALRPGDIPGTKANYKFTTVRLALEQAADQREKKASEQTSGKATEGSEPAAGVIYIDVEPRLRITDDTHYSLTEVVEKLNALGFTVVQ